jgi:phage terminase large subunit-like protein/intein/homing endonuclease
MRKTTSGHHSVLPWPDGVPKPLSAPPLTNAPSDGPKVIRWIEANCVYGEGDRFGEPVKLELFQRIFLTFLFEKRPDGQHRYRRALLELPKGNGKALALDTPLATPDGWTTMGDVRPGDVLFDEQGQQTTVLEAHPIMLGNQCYRVTFSDGSSIVADAEHLWYTEELRKEYRGAVNTTRYLKDTLITRSDGARNHRIPVAGALELPDADLPIDPYVLGAWLGDGDSDSNHITAAADEVAAMTAALAESGQSCELRPNKDRAPSLLLPGLRPQLRKSGLLGNKHIPEQYLRASVKQRLALLQGLLDTDGSISPAGQVEFCSCRERLASDTLELIQSLGIKVTISESDATIYGKVVGRRWRIHFAAPAGERLFRLERKQQRVPAVRPNSMSRNRAITRIEEVPSVPVRCIKVDSSSSLFLAGESMVPTHNTPVAAWIGAYRLATQRSAVIPVAAASYEQAELLFGDMRTAVAESPTLREVMIPFEGEIQIKNGPGRAYKVAAVAGTNDGQRPSTFLADEIHEWCLAADVEVVLADGSTRQASDVKAGDVVIAWDEQNDCYAPSRVTEARSNGIKVTYTVETRRGRSIQVTGNHQFWTERGWVRADELTRDDRVKVALDCLADGDGDIDQSYLFGVLAGDGSLTGDVIGFTCADPLLLREVQSLVGTYGCTVKAKDGSGQRYRITRGALLGSSRNPLITALRDAGMWGHGCATKTVPASVLQGGPKAWAAFLAGYLDTDGSVTRPGARQPHIRYVGTSRQLLVQCQQMLAYLGIQSDLRARSDTRSTTYLPTWELRIGGREQVRRFAELVVSRGIKAERLEPLRNIAPPQKLAGTSQDRMFGFDRVKSVCFMGVEETFGLTVDRHHTHITNGLVTHNTGNKERVHLVLANGCTKRQGSLVLNTTTPGFDIDSMAGKLHEYGLRVNNGEITDDEFLFMWWGCPADRYDLSDPEQLLKAIRDGSPAADLFLNANDVAARYHQVPENEFLRYHLGIWVPHAESWLPAGAWEDCKDESITIPDGADVCLGFDGSFNNDSTALVVVSCGQKPHIDVVQCWEKPLTANADWAVPIQDVEDAIRRSCKRWQVREIVCDVYRWARTFQILEDEGLPVVEFPQNASRMTPATQRFYEATLNKMLTHSGDQRLARHIGNAVLKVDARGQRITKESKASSRKIDLAVSAVMAYDRAAVAEGSYPILQSIW